MAPWRYLRWPIKIPSQAHEGIFIICLTDCMTTHWFCLHLDFYWPLIFAFFLSQSSLFINIQDIEALFTRKTIVFFWWRLLLWLVNRAFTPQVNTLSTHRVDTLFTQWVNALFTRRVITLSTRRVNFRSGIKPIVPLFFCIYRQEKSQFSFLFHPFSQYLFNCHFITDSTVLLTKRLYCPQIKQSALYYSNKWKYACSIKYKCKKTWLSFVYY